MEKQVQGVGMENPDTCAHGDLDAWEDMAICNTCSRVLSNLSEGVESCSKGTPVGIEDVEITITEVGDEDPD